MMGSDPNGTSLRNKRNDSPVKSMILQDPSASESEKRDNAYAESCLKAISAKLGCEAELFKRKRKKGREFHKSLMSLVFLLRENTEWNYRKIGEFLGISAIYVQKLYGKACMEEGLKDSVESIIGTR